MRPSLKLKPTHDEVGKPDFMLLSDYHLVQRASGFPVV